MTVLILSYGVGWPLLIPIDQSSYDKGTMPLDLIPLVVLRPEISRAANRAS
ncbi:MAG: hypothetical protein V7707_10580 [Motiliproteus sp.]